MKHISNSRISLAASITETYTSGRFRIFPIESCVVKPFYSEPISLKISRFLMRSDIISGKVNSYSLSSYLKIIPVNLDGKT